MTKSRPRTILALVVFALCAIAARTASAAAVLSMSPASPATLAFGSVVTGITSTAKTVQISNTGNATSGAISGAPTVPFAASSSCTSGSTTSAILAGGSCTYSYTLTPLALGAASQIVTLVGGGTTIGTVSLSGTGVATSASPVAIAITVPHQSDPDAGTLPGDVSVTPTGAATYEISIVVPPGTGGLSPSVALDYNSQGTNGIAGMGWTLSATSRITRCGKAIAQDPISGVTGAAGINGRISITTADRLCLDGQRLVRVNEPAGTGADPASQDAAYWAAGGEYRTEKDSFQRITMTTGPSAVDQNGTSITTIAFKVEAGNGRVMAYGKTSGYQTALLSNMFVPTSAETRAPLNAGGATNPADNSKVGQALSWALDSVTDASGNTMAFDYALNTTTGEHLLTQIRYGGHSTTPSQSHDLAVRFVYQTRPDSWTRYIDDLHQDQRSRIANIQTFVGTAGTAGDSTGTKVRDYALAYTTSVSSGRSLLSSVTACATNATAGTTCLPATTFSWGQVPTGATKAFASQGIWATLPILTHVNPGSLPQFPGPLVGMNIDFFEFADFENNGRTDILEKRSGRPTSPGSGTASNIQAQQLGGIPYADGTLLTSYRYFHNTGTTFTQYMYVISTGEAFVVIGTGDFNGDGAPDILVSTGVGPKLCLSPLGGTAGLGAPGSTITFNCAAGYAAMGTNVVPYGIPHIYDAVGDGRAGIFGPVQFTGSSTYCLQSACASTTSIPATIVGAWQWPDMILDPDYQYVTFDQMIDLAGTGKSNDLRFSHPYFTYYILGEPGVQTPDPQWYNLTPELLIGAINVPGLPAQQNMSYVYPGYATPPGSPAAFPYTFGVPLLSASLTGDFNGSGYSDIYYNFLQIGAAPAGWSSPSLLQAYQCLSTGRHLDCTIRQTMTNSTYMQVLDVADIDGDGQPDILTGTMTAANGTYTGLKLCHLKGDTIAGTDTNLVCDSWSAPTSVINALFYSGSGGANNMGDHVFLMDLLGTGRPQLVLYHCGHASGSSWVEDGRWEIFAPNDLAPAGQALDRIYQVTNGLGATETITYQDGNAQSLITRSGTSTLAYPQKLNALTGKYVSRVAKSNGVSANRSTSYSYRDSAVDMSGRGSLGFGVVTSVDDQTQIKTVTRYGQVWPKIGLPTSVTVTSPASVTLFTTTNTYTVVATNSNVPAVVWPYLSKQVITAADLTGSGYGTKVTTQVPADNYGNMANITVGQCSPTVPTANCVAGSYEWQTSTANTNIVNTITTSVWHLGQIGQTAVTRSNPNPPSVTRTQVFTYNSTTALLESVTVEPTDTQYKLTSTNVRDSYGNIKTTTQSWLDPVSSTMKTRLSVDQTWDSKGRFLVSARNPLVQQRTVTFDGVHGQLISTTGANGLTTSWTYDGFGKKLTETRPDGTSSQYLFKQCVGTDCTNPIGTASVVSFALDAKSGALIDTPILSFADSVGHVIQSEIWHFSGQLLVQDQSYDAIGRPYVKNRPRFTGESDAAIETRGYDILGRVTSLVTPDGTSTTSYDALISVLTNAKNQQRTETKNAIGQLTTVLDSGGGTTAFTYEPFGNLQTATDPNGNVSTMTYDLWGRRRTLADPDLGLRNFFVDPPGRVYKQDNPVMRAHVPALAVTASYDLVDRMIARTEPDLSGTWVFDGQPVVGGVTQTPAQIATACAAAHSCGQLIENFAGSSSSKSYDETTVYDTLGRFSSQTITLNGVAYLSGTSYDAWGRVLQQTSKRGSDATKSYDYRHNAYGKLYRLERQGLPLWMAMTADQLSNVTAANLGNQLVDTAQFNLLTGRLQNAQLKLGSVLQVQEAYTFDPLGNALTRTEYWQISGSQQGSSETLTYDNLNRLHTSQVAGGALQTFTFDTAGNILTKTGVGTGAYHYPTQGTAAQPHAVQSITGVSGSFSYDANGNTLTTPFGRTQTWTSFDMPLLLAQSGSSSQFTYGPDHQRTSQVRSDGTTFWYAGNIEVEVTSSQTRVKTYWPMGLGLEIDTGASTAQYWMHRDRLGSVVAVTDISGNQSVHSAFDTWGLRRNLDGSATSSPIVEALDNKGFTGQEQLDQIELVHLNGRVYDPAIGRFISADPFVTDPTNGQNYNRYTYVLNNPTNLTDPTGFCQTITGSSICVDTKEQYDQIAALLGVSGAHFDEPAQSTQQHPTNTQGGAQPSTTAGDHENSAGTATGNAKKPGEYPIPNRSQLGKFFGITNSGTACWEAGCIDDNGRFFPMEAPLQSVSLTTPIAIGIGKLLELAGCTGDCQVLTAAIAAFVLRSPRAAESAAASGEVGIAGAARGSPLLERYLAESGGRWGTSATRALNNRLATQYEAQGYRITGGAGRASEEWIPGPGGGTRGGTFVDITATNGTSTVRIQTINTLANGLPTASEAAAAARIRAAFPNDQLILIPKQ